MLIPGRVLHLGEVTGKRFFDQLSKVQAIIVRRTELFWNDTVGEHIFPMASVLLGVSEVRCGGLWKDDEAIVFFLPCRIRILEGGRLLLIQGDVDAVFLGIVHNDAEVALQEDAQALGKFCGG